MSAIGLVLGIVAYLVIRREDLPDDRPGRDRRCGGVPRAGPLRSPGRDGR